MTWFIPAGDMPEEFKKQLQEQQERHMMATQDWQHEIASFFNDMSKDQLLTARRLLNFLSSDSTGRLANFFEGKAAAILEVKYGVCSGCGIDHTAEFFEQADAAKTGATPEPDMPEDPLPGIPKVMDMHPADFMDRPTEPGDGELVAELPLLEGEAAVDEPPPLVGPSRYQQNLNKYNLSTTSIPGQVSCNNCGLIYVSLHERMKREPDDCMGCNQKGAWG